MCDIPPGLLAFVVAFALCIVKVFRVGYNIGYNAAQRDCLRVLESHVVTIDLELARELDAVD